MRMFPFFQERESFENAGSAPIILKDNPIDRYVCAHSKTTEQFKEVTPEEKAAELISNMKTKEDALKVVREVFNTGTLKTSGRCGLIVPTKDHEDYWLKVKKIIQESY